MSQSTTSFVNQNWGVTTDVSVNTYSTIGIDLEIFASDDFAIYEAYLDSDEASNKIDDDVDYLTSS